MWNVESLIIEVHQQETVWRYHYDTWDNGRQNTAQKSEDRATKNCTNIWMSLVFVIWGEKGVQQCPVSGFIKRSLLNSCNSYIICILGKNNIWEKKLILSIVTKMSIKFFLYVSEEYILTHMTKFHINIDRICSSHRRIKIRKSDEIV